MEERAKDSLEYSINKTCKNIPNGYIIKLVKDKDGTLIPQLVKKDNGK